MFLAILFDICWWGHAHSLIAGIAKKSLTSSEVSRLEKAAAYGGFEITSLEDVANWHDTLKGSASLGVMSGWHFSSPPFIKEGYDGHPKPLTYNISSYLISGWNTLTDPTTTDPWAIGFHLRSILHFVGDIHTPHHNVAYYTEKTPNGDQGGNLYKIQCKHGSACMNIHFLWDSVCFDLNMNSALEPIKAAAFEKNISRYMKSFPLKEVGPVDPTAWMMESHQIAREVGYATPEDDVPSEEYIMKCRNAAGPRVTAAGVRLGSMLKTLLNSGKIPNESYSSRSTILFVIDALLFVASCILAIIPRIYNKKK